MKPMINIENSKSALASEEKLEKLLEANISMWILRWNKQTFMDQKMFGVEDIDVVRHENPNTNEVTFIQKPAGTNVLRFVSDQHGVATAYLVDTERNRNILAGHFYANVFNIISKMTPEGAVNGALARKEIEILAKKLGIEKPKSSDMGFAEAIANRRAKIDAQTAAHADKIQANNEAHARAAVQGNVEEATEKIPTKEDILVAVLEQNRLMVNHLKNKKGAKWKESKEYKEIILGEVDRLVKIWEDKKGEAQEKTAEEGAPPETETAAEEGALVN